jgi:hypothetical protein
VVDDDPVGFTYEHPSIYRVLYSWDLFWKSVGTLSAVFKKPAIEVVAGLFYPDHFPGWNQEPLFPQHPQRREQMLESWADASKLTVERVRESMEARLSWL